MSKTPAFSQRASKRYHSVMYRRLRDLSLMDRGVVHDNNRVLEGKRVAEWQELIFDKIFK